MTERDERVSMVCERRVVSEAAFLAMLRALQPLQSHAAGLRSVAYGQSGSGGVREVTADERAIDAGAVGRGRGAWARIAGVALEHRAALRWLVDRAHVGDLGTLAALYARQCGPADLRDALDRATVAHGKATDLAAQAQTAHHAALRVARGSRAPEAVTGLTVAKLAADTAAGRLASATAGVERATAALLAWGVGALSDACAAWGDAGGERAA